MNTHILSFGATQNAEDPQHRSLDLLCGHLEVFSPRQPFHFLEALKCLAKLQDTGLPGDEIITILATALHEVTGKEMTTRTAVLGTLPAIFREAIT